MFNTSGSTYSSFSIGTASTLYRFSVAVNGGFSLIADYNGSVYNNSKGDNTVFGLESFLSNTLGVSNTSIGIQTMYTNTTGSFNTAVGSSALGLNSVGSENTAIGHYSLQANLGDNNTAVGFGSLSRNINGVDNTAIGSNAGAYFSTGFPNLNINTNQSIFIGSESRPLGNTQSNQIVIGYDALGNGSNSVTLGNDNITKTILKGNIGIGLTGPSTKLHVYATQSGAFRLQDGTQANGYILTSDSNGVASWTASVSVAVITTTSSITTNTLDDSGFSQRGRCVIINNGTYSVNITVNATSGFSSTYLKHGTASISFVQGSGRTLVQVDGTLNLDGSVGSTATIISYGTTDYLRINNA
jgi:hypothetical protein